MVSNIDRISAEIKAQAARIAPDHDLDPNVLVELAMEIVDLEDRHRTQATSVKKKMEDCIVAVARATEVGDA